MRRLSRAQKRRLRQQVARSWQDPVAAEYARDLLAQDKHMRRNPPKDPRYATTRRVRRPPPKPLPELTTRVYRKNPRRRKETPREQEARLSRWWQKRTAAEKRRLLTMLSPAMCRNPGDRAMDKAMRSMARADRARGRRRKSHVRSYDRWMGKIKRNPKTKVARTPSSRDWRGYKSVKRALRVNPKRDGSPTRGEKRRVKYLSYLKSIQAKGQDAAASIARLTSEVVKSKPADAYAPVGPRATRRVERMGDVDYATKRIEAEGGLDTPVAVSAPEPTEVKFIRSKLEDLDALLKDAQGELKELDADSDMDADMISEIHARIADIAKRKRNLQSKLADLAQTQTNPRRRGKRAMVRVRRSTLLRMDRTVRSLCKAITTLNRAARR